MSAAELGGAPMEMIASAPARMGLREIGDWAARIEHIGFDVIHVSETIHDPFSIAAMALTHTALDGSDQHGAAVSSQSHDHRLRGVGPREVLRGPLPAGDCFAGARQHRWPLLLPVVRACFATSRLHRVATGNLPFIPDS